MHELYLQLLTYIRGSWRYRWYMMLVAWLICVVGWGYIQELPDYIGHRHESMSIPEHTPTFVERPDHQYKQQTTGQPGHPYPAKSSQS